MQGVCHEVAMSDFVLLNLLNLLQLGVRIQKRIFARSGGGVSSKLSFPKRGKPKIGPSSWQLPKLGVVHTKPKYGLSGQ